MPTLTFSGLLLVPTNAFFRRSTRICNPIVILDPGTRKGNTARAMVGALAVEEDIHVILPSDTCTLLVTATAAPPSNLDPSAKIQVPPRPTILGSLIRFVAAIVAPIAQLAPIGRVSLAPAKSRDAPPTIEAGRESGETRPHVAGITMLAAATPQFDLRNDCFDSKTVKLDDIGDTLHWSYIGRRAGFENRVERNLLQTWAEGPAFAQAERLNIASYG
ncbi:hypothetical protein R3P38DRAFT_3164518 [Favolaschia claudopus]|uniref:Uncharacterized protein n=1 Tax=Favolaschia claudopus TaxID=2862362 RepID=A0AAW0ED01_9AGAR